MKQWNCAVFVCFFASAGFASTLTSVTATATDLNGNTLASDTESNPNSSSASVNASEFPPPAPYNQGYPFGIFQTSGNGTANASQGFLKILLQANGPEYACSNNFSFNSCVIIASTTVTGTASLSDTITLLGGSGTANLVWNAALDCSLPGCNPAAVTFTPDLPTQVTFGVPFQISASLTGTVASPSPGCGNCNGGLLAQFFLPTPTVNGSSAFTYTTASGFADFVGGTFVATPEPSAIALAAIGLVAAFWRCRRKFSSPTAVRRDR